MNNGIILPSQPVSISYSITIVFLPACVSSFIAINNWFLLRLTQSILTVSPSPSLTSCTSSTSSLCMAQSLLLWHTFLKWPALPHPMHVLPYTRHCLDAWIHHNICRGIVALLCLVCVSHYPLLAFRWSLFYQIDVILLYYWVWQLELSVHLFVWPMLACLHLSPVHCCF